MHLLLPPSETKHPGGRGAPLSRRPSHPLLGEPRARAVAALADLLAGPREQAAAALLLPGGTLDAALAADRAVLDSPTTPALRRYAGVVYDGVAALALETGEQRLLARRTFVFSGLFGVVRGDEPIPVYRVPAKAALPGLGVAGTFWRPHLERIVPTLLRRGLVVDLRSSDYAAMWRACGELAERTVAVRVLSPLPRGGEGVVSFASKFAKGRLAAALARREAGGDRLDGAADVAETWLELGGRAARVTPGGGVVIHT